MLLVETEISGAGQQAEFPGRKRFGARVNHAADGIGAVERGARAF